MPQERLQKILARAGVASRRAAEQLITGGRVTVNGAVVTELGARADTDSDRIDVDGKPVAREDHVYYLIHKPRGMVTTLKDPEDRPSLSELLHNIPERIYPVGRLDFHTSGALLLTNDGDLAQALLHPSRAVPKTYVVKVSVEVGETMLQALERGVVLDDGYQTQQAFVEHIRDEDEKSWIQITITEGKNRQIHRMIEALGARVMRLSRISFAGLSTENLRPGEIRPLFQDEVAALKRDYITEAPAHDKSAREPREAGEAKPAREKPGREYTDRGGAPRGPAVREKRVGEASTPRRPTREAAPGDAARTSDRPAAREGQSRDRPTPRGAERGSAARDRPAARATTLRSRAEDPRASTPREPQGEEATARKPVRDRLPRAYLESGRDRPARDAAPRGKFARASGGRDRPAREAPARDQPGASKAVAPKVAAPKFGAAPRAARDKPAAKHGDQRYAASDRAREGVREPVRAPAKASAPVVAKPRVKGDTRPRSNTPSKKAPARNGGKRD
ncbi:MAG: hypothetical protein RLZZ450_2666 [Pseudomonadota bacterium]|jgi:23S rRNA pseudouridine2605 synthase